jgi:hypothetical protein
MTRPGPPGPGDQACRDSRRSISLRLLNTLLSPAGFDLSHIGSTKRIVSAEDSHGSM